MNSIEIRKFKAFKDKIIVNFENKNLLIYGENGSGKTSIYEAIKLVFYREKLLSAITSQTGTPEEDIQLEKRFWESYNNKINNEEFEILINNTSHNNFTVENYQTSLVSYNEIFYHDDFINYISLLEKLFLAVNIEKIKEELFGYIEVSVNSLLNEFGENISIKINKENDYKVLVDDSQRKLFSNSDLRTYFNDGKLHLVKLLLIFESIRFSEDNQKEHVLILDDIITSLDSANRTFIFNYIIKNFRGYKIIILTHNVSFYNLISYILKDQHLSSGWMFANIYEIREEHKIVFKGEKNVAEIESARGNGNVEELGNKIRQMFEVLLYEYSKLFMIGAVEDNKKILEFLEKEQCLYYHDGKTALDLVNEIDRILNNSTKNQLIQIKKKIEVYKVKDLDYLRSILQELKIYRKVALHPLSHGSIGQTFYSKRNRQIHSFTHQIGKKPKRFDR
jgi:energy-coupling factor transporter ATP-binding protein EcfA2